MCGNVILITTCLLYHQLVYADVPVNNMKNNYPKIPQDNGNTYRISMDGAKAKAVIGRRWSNDVIDCIQDDNVGGCLEMALNKSVNKLEILNQINKLYNITVDNGRYYNVPTVKDFAISLDLLIEKLKSKINQEVQSFHHVKNVGDNFTAKVVNTKEKTFDLIIINNNGTGRSFSGRRMKFQMGNVLYYLLIPALAMAGIMPWILPQIKMIATVIMIMNQIALSMGAMSLIRGLIFDPEPQEHIIYINNGYKNNPPKTTSYKYKHKN